MSVPAHPIEHEASRNQGRYTIRLDGGPLAEMTYRRLAPDLIAIDHTLVPSEYRGQGVAQQLVERAVADARRDGFKIIPICSYAVAQFRRHPEWEDLLGH